MYAVVRSGPPKQTFVTNGSYSGTVYWSSSSPLGDTTLTAPVINVATQMLPSLSTAIESSSW